MARINCKICGCPNETVEGKLVVICEACGTEQTIPNLDSEKKVNLFNRANAARLKNDFDKALQNYESILIDYPQDAEAHWGIVLCRYGIEYVDDPKTKKKIPTCHRTLYNSIFDDVDYKDAIANSDVIVRKIYQEEAEKIDKIQKTIITISQKEEPYDIFICYKETDESGNRTRDSFVAEDIYNELTNKGYKVFFSRITLESKLGQQYEPIIFAALRSSKVMLVIGSKKEYFEAVWVKNEWSRYLSFIAEAKGSKYMIPCYRDMEAYDMPDEFLALQSQNLDRLGAKQDLIRVIDKVFGKDKKTNVENLGENASDIQENKHDVALLKRALLFIEDGEYSKADECLEKVLDNNPECAEAYTYKILIERKLHNPEDLSKLSSPLDDDRNYQKALRFASDEYKLVIEGYNNKIISNLNEKNKKSIYNTAISAKEKGNFEEAITLFNRVIDYKDSKIYISMCENNIKDNIYVEASKLKNEKKYDEAIETFNKIIYYKDSQQQIAECKEIKIASEKERMYSKNVDLAVKYSSHDEYNENEFKQAIFNLKKIVDYKDTADIIKIYNEKFLKMGQQLAEEEEALRIENSRKKAEREKQAKIRKDKRIRLLKIFTPIAIGVITICILTFTLFIPMSKYNKAMGFLTEGKYEEAREIFEGINYGDSKNQIEMINATNEFSEGDYEAAIAIINNIGGSVAVSYDADGGDAITDNEIIKKMSFIINEAMKDGYTFYGWTLEFYDINFEAYSANITLKASYTPIEYKIIYNLNGGMANNLPGEYIKTDVVNIPNPTRTGYKFLGWTGTKLEGLTKNLNFSNDFGNKEFTANWEANTYTITYDVNGGDELEENTQLVIYDGEVTLAVPKKTGYTFAGWYYNDELVDTQIWQIGSNAVLVARWTPNTDTKYVINHYLENANDDEFVLDSSEECFGTSDAEITPNYKTYIGYNIPKVEKIVISADGNTVYDIYYKRKIVTISYVTNGGLDIESISKKYGSTVDSSIVAVREGYTFGGWYTDYMLTNTFNYVVPSDDCNLYAYWNEETKTSDFTVDIYQDHGTVNGYNSVSNQKVCIPSYIAGKPITRIWTYAFNNHSEIIELIVPKNIISLEKGVFKDLFSLEKITLPFVGDSLDKTYSTYFGYVFGMSYSSDYDKIPPSLKEVTILQGTTIDEYAFSYCSSIEILNIPDEILNIGDYAFYGCTNIVRFNSDEEYVLNTPSKCETIGEYAFGMLSKIKEVVVSDTVTSIGDYVFTMMIALEELSIPYIPNNESFDVGIGKIFSYLDEAIDEMYAGGARNSGDYKYYIPTSLKIVNITKSTYIPGYAFYGCTSIEKINLHKDVQNIGNYAFYGCTNIVRFNSDEEYVLNTPSKCETIGKYAFGMLSKIKKVIVCDTVTSIGDYVFDRMIALEELSIPYIPNNESTYVGIGKIFSYSNNSISEMYIGGARDSSGYQKYYIPTSLTIINITKSTDIPGYAFYGCKNVEVVNIPEGTLNIDNYAFYDCTNLSRLNSNTEGKVNLPVGIVEISNYLFYKCESIFEIILSNETLNIGDYAFYGCTNIVRFNSDEEYVLNTPSKCETIGKYAFGMLSKIKKVIVCDTVTSIGDYVFDRMIALEELSIPYIPNNESTYVGIGKIFSYSNNSISEMYIGGARDSSGYQKYYIPTSLTIINITRSTDIPGYAFYNCKNVKIINLRIDSTLGNDAIYNCQATINYVFENPYFSNNYLEWDGKTMATKYDSGDGTIDNPYVIANSIQFAYFVNQINARNTYS